MVRTVGRFVARVVWTIVVVGIVVARVMALVLNRADCLVSFQTFHVIAVNLPGFHLRGLVRSYLFVTE